MIRTPDLFHAIDRRSAYLLATNRANGAWMFAQNPGLSGPVGKHFGKQRLRTPIKNQTGTASRMLTEDAVAWVPKSLSPAR